MKSIQFFKIVIICSLVLFGENFVLAQWNPIGGNTTVPIDRTGDVGIGSSSSPTIKLAVSGNQQYGIFARVQSNSGFNSAIVGNNPSNFGVAKGVEGYSFHTGNTSSLSAAYGVFGSAGGAPINFNYGVVGKITGSNSGAGIVGLDLANASWNGNTQGTWAGYFKGNAHVSGKLGIKTVTPIQDLDINGRIHVADGVIQRGGVPITNTSDLGLYSLGQFFWMRFVTNDAPIRFFSDGGTTPIGGNALMTIEPNGNVGIGTVAPSEKLFVSGGNALIQGIGNFSNAGDQGILYVGDQYHKITSEFGKGVTIGTFNMPDPHGIFLQQITGNVGIGTDLSTNIFNNIPDYFKLSVCGPVRATAIVVETGWCDYVFEEDYELTSLKDVEAHIKEKGYLHNTPSASEIESNGLEVGVMTVNQQEKIEELFLHLIAMDKRMKILETENSGLKEALEVSK